MIFRTFAVEEAEGLVLAHAVRLSDQILRKGHRLTRSDVEQMSGEGIKTVLGARLESDDMLEDEAATWLAAALPRTYLRCSKAATGRVNVYATVAGLFTADKAAVDRCNAVDPAITLACLADHARVAAGDMVATFKIIPLAVARSKVSEAAEILGSAQPLDVRPFRPHAVALILTLLPSLKSSLVDKTRRVLEQRLARSGSSIVSEARVPHDTDTVAEAIRLALGAQAGRPDLIVIFGASAVSDPLDVIPQAIRLAGGEVVQVGMPVDPGNLLVLGEVGATPVLGAPGCARSPKENGFDWVLDRLLAGEKVGAQEIRAMGVGGLLVEIPSRPQPRETSADRLASVAAVLLAAGTASRIGDGRHKLLAEFDGVALVRRIAQAACDSDIADLVVVTGHRYAEIEAALAGLPAEIAHNPDFATGMASSLIAGFASNAAARADGMLVMLADMPAVTTADLSALIDAFRAARGQAIVRAVARGVPGNPVILPSVLRSEVMRLEGDVGARHLIESAGVPVIDVEIGDNARLDVDTADAVVAAGGILKR
ncbi:molybdopterin-binding/glycosyltransferase family 2 protein [Sphingomonas sp.]|uniref:molybdopterin-binding/glycosyltransferase family 2 protein n=1 Tax=Sphingomonas sp. TaxID=28214 RepID=UPI002FC6B483